MVNPLIQKQGGKLLIAGAMINILTAILHISIPFIGKAAYQYFGAPPEIITLAQEGYFAISLLIMFLLSTLFFVAGLYGLSGAGLIRPIPFRSVAILLIGILYTLRGSVVILLPFPHLANKLIQLFPSILGMGREIMFQDWLFSFVWLVTGIFYLIGYAKIKLASKDKIHT